MFYDLPTTSLVYTNIYFENDFRYDLALPRLAPVPFLKLLKKLANDMNDQESYLSPDALWTHRPDLLVSKDYKAPMDVVIDFSRRSQPQITLNNYFTAYKDLETYMKVRRMKKDEREVLLHMDIKSHQATGKFHPKAFDALIAFCKAEQFHLPVFKDVNEVVYSFNDKAQWQPQKPHLR